MFIEMLESLDTIVLLTFVVIVDRFTIDISYWLKSATEIVFSQDQVACSNRARREGVQLTRDVGGLCGTLEFIYEPYINLLTLKPQTYGN